MSAEPALHGLFSDADRAAVEEAVREAERETSGQIVVSVVRSCDVYTHAQWKGAACGALLGSLMPLALHSLSATWNSGDLWLLLSVAAGAAVGYVLPSLSPAWHRFFATPQVMESRAHARAAEAFLRAEVFRTRERTGILLFLALLERRVVVLADSGIHTKVGESEWSGIVAGIVGGMNTGRPASALVDAIRRCGELLRQHGFVRSAQDVDELPDRLRTED